MTMRVVLALIVAAVVSIVLRAMDWPVWTYLMIALAIVFCWIIKHYWFNSEDSRHAKK